MPSYRYRCSRCESVEERNVPVDARDSQQCECGRVLRREFEPTSHIHVPVGFTQFDPGPKSAYQQQVWDDLDVRPSSSFGPQEMD